MRLLFFVAIVTFVLDQASKWYVVHYLQLAIKGQMDVLPPFVNFRMAWNYGVNFGLGASSSDIMRWVLSTVAVVIVVFVLWWVKRNPPGKFGLISAGLLVGGALGNVIDRVLYGAVADFLNMSCCGIRNPYSFNVADITIFIGAIGLALMPESKKAT